jgi:hypothetical protein
MFGFKHCQLYHLMSVAAHTSLGRGFRRNRAIIVIWARELLISGVADHVLHFGDHFLGLKRLSEKAAVGGNIDVCELQLP